MFTLTCLLALFLVALKYYLVREVSRIRIRIHSLKRELDRVKASLREWEKVLAEQRHRTQIATFRIAVAREVIQDLEARLSSDPQEEPEPELSGSDVGSKRRVSRAPSVFSLSA